MRAVVLALGLALAATGAFAQSIAPGEAKAHFGQVVTVEGAVSDVYTARSGVTFLDIGGAYPDNAFAAVIFTDDAGKFPDVEKLKGKIVDITGSIRLYQGRPEIILNDPAQIRTK
jgi:hypothetical protein